jgi:fatty acyl-CoA reductase
MTKIVAVTGDVTLPGYGLSASDLNLLIENVSIVFNSAATIKFNEELKDAIEMNVKGPMQLLEICRQMKRLEVLSHYIKKQLNNIVTPINTMLSLMLTGFCSCIDGF